VVRKAWFTMTEVPAGNTDAGLMLTSYDTEPDAPPATVATFQVMAPLETVPPALMLGGGSSNVSSKSSMMAAPVTAAEPAFV